MSETNFKGRVTIPTDVDVVPETLELVKRWGADAIRDCDGTDYPEELKMQMQKYILLTTQQEKTMNGQRQIRTKFSRCTL